MMKTQYICMSKYDREIYAYLPYLLASSANSDTWSCRIHQLQIETHLTFLFHSNQFYVIIMCILLEFS